jgi:hypothetical protein
LEQNKISYAWPNGFYTRESLFQNIKHGMFWFGDRIDPSREKFKCRERFALPPIKLLTLVGSIQPPKIKTNLVYILKKRLPVITHIWSCIRVHYTYMKYRSLVHYRFCVNDNLFYGDCNFKINLLKTITNIFLLLA